MRTYGSALFGIASGAGSCGSWMAANAGLISAVAGAVGAVFGAVTAGIIAFVWILKARHAWQHRNDRKQD